MYGIGYKQGENIVLIKRIELSLGRKRLHAFSSCINIDKRCIEKDVVTYIKLAFE